MNVPSTKALAMDGLLSLGPLTQHPGGWEPEQACSGLGAEVTQEEAT